MRRYIFWSGLSNFTGSMLSTISTESVLSAVSKTETMTNTYIGRDIIGQLAGVSFALLTGKKADSNTVKYLKYGLCLQQGGYYLDLSVPLVPTDQTIYWLGLSSSLKNLSFITLGAVNANNMRKMDADNIGKVYSILASTNTIASTLGSLCGLYMLTKPDYKYICCPILSSISVYSLIKGTKIFNK